MRRRFLELDPASLFSFNMSSKGLDPRPTAVHMRVWSSTHLAVLEDRVRHSAVLSISRPSKHIYTPNKLRRPQNGEGWYFQCSRDVVHSWWNARAYSSVSRRQKSQLSREQRDMLVGAIALRIHDVKRVRSFPKLLALLVDAVVGLYGSPSPAYLRLHVEGLLLFWCQNGRTSEVTRNAPKYFMPTCFRGLCCLRHR
ncbi:hypothetical protein F5J12DRAFT_854846 [Pisolithus orientalis]|uniref:uncharacterized protein n=1 Tax=Pisolithus orientalis TaxID=936130 RepID=UPI0022251E2D|nr:uncharacterized protein F5J12DRAFT_854846 [Pisolithus orientalis]KAI5995754.1 hypothetical protein F5J12DRAFT_854846 [Pisolithus orientalis]